MLWICTILTMKATAKNPVFVFLNICVSKTIISVICGPTCFSMKTTTFVWKMQMSCCFSYFTAMIETDTHMEVR